MLSPLCGNLRKKNPYRPTELDALVFGHLFTLLTTPLPDPKIVSIIKQHKNLVELCQAIDREYFDNVGASSGGSSEDFQRI